MEPNQGEFQREYYVRDVEFRSKVVVDQTPLRIGLVSAFSGYVPPDFKGFYRYVDLCCGDGTTIIALAKLNPQAEFWGLDFNPIHLKKARESVEKYSLKNVFFLEADLAEFEYEELPEFDFVAINGAYSWLSEKAKERVLDFVEAKLKRGGLFYVEYMALPGRLAIGPLWKLIQMLVPEEQYSDGRERAKKGLYYLRTLARRGLNYLKAHPTATKAAQFYLNLTKVEDYYVDHFAHNALAGGFRPLYFFELYDQLKKRGLEYVGSTEFFFNDLELAVPPTHLSTFFEISDRRLVETLKDFILNTMDRRDLFIKGKTSSPSESFLFLKERIKLFPLVPLSEITKVLTLFGGYRIPLKGGVYDRIFDLLEKGEEVVELSLLEGFPESQILKALNRLMATYQFGVVLEKPFSFKPISEVSELRVKLLEPLNEEYLERAERDGEGVVLISPLTGGAGPWLTLPEVIMLQELRKTGKLEASLLLEKLKSSKPVSVQTLSEVEQLGLSFLKRKLPQLIKYGILEVSSL